MQVAVKNVSNIIFQVVIFRELCDARGLWQTLFLLPNYFMVLILLFTINMGGMWKGSSLLSHLQA